MKTLQRRLVRLAAAVVAVIGWGAVLVAPTGASAALVTFSYQGTVNSVVSSLGSQFTVGQIFTYTYTFESTTADNNIADPTNGVYNNAITSYSATVGSYTATGSSGFINVLDDFGTFDQYFVFGAIPSAPSVSGVDLESVRMKLRDNSASVFSSDSLPTIIPDPTLFPDIQVLELLFADGSNVLAGNISITPVPLPAALPLFLSALAGLALLGRRRRQADA